VNSNEIYEEKGICEKSHDIQESERIHIKLDPLFMDITCTKWTFNINILSRFRWNRCYWKYGVIFVIKKCVLHKLYPN